MITPSGKKSKVLKKRAFSLELDATQATLFRIERWDNFDRLI